MTISPFAYCWAVGRPSAVFLGLCLAVVALAFVSASYTGLEADLFVFLTLVVQTFAVSTGFRGPALRGRYDPLLLGGCSRLRLGVALWSASASPGICAWMAMALLIGYETGTWIVLDARHVVALALASTVPWAISIGLPRLAGGMVSLIVLVMLGTSRWSVDLVRVALGRVPDYGLEQIVQCTILFALCPYLLPGSAPPGPGSSPLVLALELVLAAAALWLPIAYIAAAEYPLTPRS